MTGVILSASVARRIAARSSSTEIGSSEELLGELVVDVGDVVRSSPRARLGLASTYSAGIVLLAHVLAVVAVEVVRLHR